MILKAACQKGIMKLLSYKACLLDEFSPFPIQFFQLFGNIRPNLLFADFNEIVSSFI